MMFSAEGVRPYKSAMNSYGQLNEQPAMIGHAFVCHCLTIDAIEPVSYNPSSYVDSLGHNTVDVNNIFLLPLQYRCCAPFNRWSNYQKWMKLNFIVSATSYPPRIKYPSLINITSLCPRDVSLYRQCEHYYW
jgi:hypothetical protein